MDASTCTNPSWHDDRPARIVFVGGRQHLPNRIRSALSGLTARLTVERNLDRLVERCEESVVDLAMLAGTALREGPGDAREILEILAAKSPWTQVLLLVQPREIALAAPVLKTGICQYARLPMDAAELRLLVESALAQRPAYDPRPFVAGSRREARFEDMVGASPAMRDVYRMIRQAAATDIPVLLTGETGTGKDLAAKAVHQLSDRSVERFLPAHLGALPPDLVASSLFGHERGAFTGAENKRVGSFEQAHGGTIFLDEISTIDDRVQVSLLRLLETRTFQRIGGQEPLGANVRIIAATNENLEQAVKRGDFREDLYYRLEVFQIHMPPLRERAGDLPLLIDHFLKRYAGEYSRPLMGLAPDCLALLESYDWPGNVRELKNVIHRAVVVCPGDVLTPDHLKSRLRARKGLPRQVVLPVGSTLEQAEREMIRQTLRASGPNRRRAAAILGISRGTLYNKMRKYGLQ